MSTYPNPHKGIEDPETIEMVRQQWFKDKPRLTYQPVVKEYDITVFNPKTNRKEYYVVDINKETDEMIRVRLAQW